MKQTERKIAGEVVSAVKKKQTGKAILFLLILLILYIGSRSFTDNGSTVQWSDDASLNADTSLVVHYIDVGQGDAVYITLPTGESMLIDAGTNASEDRLLAYLDQYDAGCLDYAVFTHPHEDHIGGADKVLARYGAKTVIIPDVETTTSTYEKMIDAIIDCGAETVFSAVSDTYTLGDAVFRILGPVTPSSDDLNNASIVVHFTYRDVSFLFTGDAEKSEEKSIIDAVGSAALKADVLKVGHHGSSTSSSAAFLDAVSPLAAVISCGADNDYGHPHAETVDELQKRGVTMLRTDECGSIRICSDGTALLIRTDRDDS